MSAATVEIHEHDHLSAVEMVGLAKDLLACTPPPHFLSSGAALRWILDKLSVFATDEDLLSVVDELVAAHFGGGVARSPTVGMGLALSLLALSANHISFHDNFQLTCLQGCSRAGKQEALKAFFTALQSNSQVTSLSLAGAAFATQEAAAQLAHYLNVTSTLLELDIIDSCGFFEQAGVWGAFSDTLQSNSSLHTLSLYPDRGGCEFGAHTVATFNRFSGLSHIILYGLNTSWGGVSDLLAGLLSPGNAPTLTHLDVSFDDERRASMADVVMELMGRMADALMLNTTLTCLQVTGPCIHSFNSSFPECVCARFAAMLDANCTLKVLEFRGGVPFNECVGRALSQNRSLETVRISLDKGGANALFRPLSGDGLLTLECLNMEEAVGDAKALAHMLASNKTLHKLKLNNASYSKEDWAHHILPALASNTTLQALDLAECSGVDEQRVYQALMQLLWINTSIHNIQLNRTPLESAGKAEAIKAAVKRNVEYRAALKDVPTIPPKSCRLVLCGHPYAGKTTLVETMHRCLTEREEHCKVQNKYSRKEEEKPRTRGCEITTLLDEPSLRICAWDFAGHRQYYALHDCIFSSTNGSSIFLFAYTPITIDCASRNRKTHVSFHQDLEYWLRFIASNSQQLDHVIKPKVIVVITHQDQPDARMNEHQAGLIVRKLAKTFRKVVDVYGTPFMVDASCDHDVRPILDMVHGMFKGLVLDLPKVPIICEQFRLDLENWMFGNGNSPIITTAEYCILFRETNVSQLPFENSTSLETLDAIATFISLDRSWHIVAKYLHDAGAILYFEDLDFVVINPHWFAHGILGYLVNPSFSSSLQPGYRPPFQPQNGLVDVEALQGLLEDSLAQMGVDKSLVTTERFIQLMLRLNLCYEQVHITIGGGERDRKFLIPSLLGGEGGGLGGTTGSSSWGPSNEKETCVFVGLRLQCEDTTCTFLTPGFFPRLQVEMYNWCLREGWITLHQLDTTDLLRANVFEISVDGHDIKLEHSGDAGYFVDILIRSFKSYSEAVTFAENKLVAKIRRFCASQKGCLGVLLEEHVIRKKCVQTLTLCKYRKEQSVLWTDLRDNILKCHDKVHIQHWQAIAHENETPTFILDANREYATLVKDENESDIIILGESMEEVSALLISGERSGSSIIPSWVAEDKQCYPNTSVKQGKRRGLALVISMEANRPGGAVDRGRLESFALSAHFEVDATLVDSTATEICAHVKELAQDATLKEDDCFLCFINSHGRTEDGQQVVGDKNGDKIFLLRDIMEPFKRSKHLAGKPKVFFINACRGDLKHADSRSSSSPSEEKTATEHTEEAEEDKDDQISAGNKAWKLVLRLCALLISVLVWIVCYFGGRPSLCWLWRPQPQEGKGEELINEPSPEEKSAAVEESCGENECLTFLENLTDWLIVLSTTENAMSFRKRTKGTMFVKALAEALVTGCQTTDVVSILNVVNREVTHDFAKERDGSGTLSTYRQTPVVQHTLRKKLYWGHVARSGV